MTNITKVLTEFVGSFLFMFAIALAASGGSALAPLAIGGGLMIMVYMGGHISGGHYNPAVSLAACIRGALPSKDVAPYMIAQIAGGIAAFLLGGFVCEKTVTIAPGDGVSMAQAMIVEGVFTFALALVVLQTATNPKVAGNSFYGLAIGFTIVVAAIAGGPISGGCFNPAVGIGAAVADITLGGGTLDNLWMYIVAPLAGGVLAAVVYKIMTAGDAPPASA
jgi:aquaporin Z